MTLSGTKWAIVTSHHKWVFLRKLDDRPVMLYSGVELQEENTRPFRALIAMILAAGGLITIPPPPEHSLLPPANSKKRFLSDVDLSFEEGTPSSNCNDESNYRPDSECSDEIGRAHV